MKRLPTPIAMWLTLVLALPAQAATLAWKFTPGDVQNYRLTQRSQLSVGAAEASKPLASVEQVIEIAWKVLGANGPDEARISLEVTAFSLLVEGPDGQEVRYDSESTEEPQGYAAMLAPIGKRLAESPLEFTMNTRGEVSELELADEVAEAVKLVPGGKRYAQDGGLLSIETMARLGAPLELPAGDVAAGHAWSVNRESELPVMGPTRITFDYEIADTDSDKEMTIEQRLTISTEGEDPNVQLGEQQSTGTIVFNVEHGRPETATLNVDVEILRPGNPDGPLKLKQNGEFRRLADETQ